MGLHYSFLDKTISVVDVISKTKDPSNLQTLFAHLISYADLPFFSLVVPEAENHNYLLSH